MKDRERSREGGEGKDCLAGSDPEAGPSRAAM